MGDDLKFRSVVEKKSLLDISIIYSPSKFTSNGLKIFKKLTIGGKVTVRN